MDGQTDGMTDGRPKPIFPLKFSAVGDIKSSDSCGVYKNGVKYILIKSTNVLRLSLSVYTTWLFMLYHDPIIFVVTEF